MLTGNGLFVSQSLIPKEKSRQTPITNHKLLTTPWKLLGLRQVLTAILTVWRNGKKDLQHSNQLKQKAEFPKNRVCKMQTKILTSHNDFPTGTGGYVAQDGEI